MQSDDGCGIGCLKVIVAFLAICVVSGLIHNAIHHFSKNDTKSKPKKTVTRTVKKKKPKVNPDVASVSTIRHAFVKATGHKAADVEYYKETGFAVITFKDKGDSLSDTDFVRENATRYINTCRRAYKLKGLKDLRYCVEAKMMDMSGDTSWDGNAMAIGMKKSVFNTYKWDSYEYEKGAISDMIDSGDFYKFFVDDNIRQDVKWSKVYYMGNIKN
jgi:hypothetical protein